MKSHLTAIARKTLPLPSRWLLAQGLLHGRVLDYGCGRCGPINNRLISCNLHVDSVTNFDPYYAPIEIKGKFDTIICNYVLCVLPENEGQKVLEHIQKLLKPTGKAFISVRNDVPRQGHGISSRGTYQRWVELPKLPLIRKTEKYRTFLLTPETDLV